MSNDPNLEGTELKQLQRYAARYAVVCALFGLLIACLMAAVMLAVVGIGFHEFVLIIPTPILVAVISLFIAAIVLGRVSGSIIYRFGAGHFVTIVTGIVLAFSCTVIATYAGVLTGSMQYQSPEPLSISYMSQLGATIIGFGAIPAIILGLVFSFLIRSALASGPTQTQEI